MPEILRIAQNDPLYPKNLLKPTVPTVPTRIHNSIRKRTEQGKPPVLYATGPFSNTDKTAFLATIGSRKISPEHINITADFLQKFFLLFGQEYPTAILSIISGMAVGGDSVGHQMALANGIETIAVSATPINHLQKYGNPEVFDDLQNPNTKGAIISEYAPTNEPVKENYLDRNRIVAWMSGSVLVYGVYRVESGAMHTVSLARHVGIPVYFIEGTVYKNVKNVLAGKGAIGVKNADDFMGKIALNARL